MGMQIRLVIVIFLGLLGAFFAFRAGIHSLQISRREASWPERSRQRAAGWRFFGLSFLLVLVSIACVSYLITGSIARPLSLPSATPSPTWTGTLARPQAPTSTSIWTSAPLMTDTTTQTSAPVETSTITLVPSRTPLPSDTHWATWTPSLTSTSTSTRTPTMLPSATSTLLPTRTPTPTDTRWPDPTSTSTK